MRLRQVALVARDLEPVRERIFRLLGIEKDFADPGVGEFGLHNSVMSMGDTFLEVVAPMQPGTTAERLLERRGGDGGYMVLAQVDDIDPVRAKIDALGIRRVWTIERPDVRAFHVHPRDIGAAIVSFDQMKPYPEWLWGGPDWRDQVAANVGNITGVDIQGTDPEALAHRWSEAFSRPTYHEGGRFVMPLDDGSHVDFVEAVDGRGDGVAAVSFAVRDGDALRDAAARLDLDWQDNEVMLCGTVFRFDGL